ncbi:MAG: Obg family GTPase CgtA [Roseiflexaceae bacterium]|nr:Obg family GTPase CgtA [Roseiflexaceae bacterium]
MNKHSSIKSAGSLLERASEMYDFGAALRGGPVPVAPEVAPEPTPAPSVEQPVAAPHMPMAARPASSNFSTINRERLAANNFIVPGGPVTGLSEEFRIVKRQLLLAARGGKGGLGNIHFTTSTHQAPRIAELGEPGQELMLELELKLLADVGLVGFPNAGKSTLIAAVSAAKPKIAPYPFTTLQPNLGVAEVGDFTFVIADIPGIIEGAHRGVGLGFDFLRHIERTGMILHVVDAAGTDYRDPVEDYHTILNELREYAPELAERPRVVALNKVDLPEAQANLELLRAAIELPDESVFTISAATRAGIDPLMQHIAALLSQTPRASRVQSEEVLEWPVSQVSDRVFNVEQVEGGYRVNGKRIERLVSMTNFAQSDSLMRLQRVMEATGINRALLEAGVQEGNLVFIEKAELEWSSEYGA